MHIRTQPSIYFDTTRRKRINSRRRNSRRDDGLGEDEDASYSSDEASSSSDDEGFSLTTDPSVPVPPLSVQNKISDRLGRFVYEDDGEESDGTEDDDTYGYECYYYYQQDANYEARKVAYIAAHASARAHALSGTKEASPPKQKKSTAKSVDLKAAKKTKPSSLAKKAQASVVGPSPSCNPPPASKISTSTSKNSAKPPMDRSFIGCIATNDSDTVKKPTMSGRVPSDVMTRPEVCHTPSPSGKVPSPQQSIAFNHPKIRPVLDQSTLSEAEREQERKRKMMDRVRRSKWFLERKKMKFLKDDSTDADIDVKRKRLQSLQSSVDGVYQQIAKRSKCVTSDGRPPMSKPPDQNVAKLPASQASTPDKPPAVQQPLQSTLPLQMSESTLMQHPQQENNGSKAPEQPQSDAIIKQQPELQLPVIKLNETRSNSLFDKFITKILAFKAENGHCNVQCKDPKWGELGRWVKRQRYQYKLWVEGDRRSSMTPERINRLDSIGFIWDSQAHTWNTRYNELVEYHKKHGHCHVPRHYSLNPSLGSWMRSQRAYYRLYKKGKNTALLPERAEMLEAIGFSDLPPRIISEEGETKQFTFVGDFSGSS